VTISPDKRVGCGHVACREVALVVFNGFETL
jgi:hypothetical protein